MEAHDSPSSPSVYNRFRSRALGAFIVVQLGYLVLANISSVWLFLSKSSDSPAIPIWRGAAAIVVDPWGELTGQEQYWRMFAPDVPHRSMFLHVNTTHGDGRATSIPSIFEPADDVFFFHPPGCGERIWHVEKSLALPFAIYDPVAIAERRDEWNDYIRGAVEAKKKPYLAFVNWATRGASPTDVGLKVSIHTQSRFDRRSRPEFDVAILRWRPATGAMDVSVEP